MENRKKRNTIIEGKIMSESFTSGESFSHQSSQRGESGETYKKSRSISQKNEIEKIKNNLKIMEEKISSKLNFYEKNIFIEKFRTIIVEKEKEVIKHPTYSFFLQEFQELELEENIKKNIIEIITNLYLQEKTKSPLKYW